MNIKTVAFDFGGVICYPPSSENRARVEELVGVPGEVLWKLDKQYRGEWDRGTYDGAGYYRFMLEQVGVFLDDEMLAKAAHADLDGWKHTNPGTVQLMREVKAAGLKLGVLSNMSIECIAWAKEGLPVLKEADVVILSSDYNIVKPEPAIYELLKKQAGCEYGEIVFFDDIVNNVKMANEMGIHAFLWEGAETAREQLVKLGLEFLAHG